MNAVAMRTTMNTIKSSLATSLPLKSFSLEEYQRITRNGILDENDRVELLYGCIISKMSINPPHSAAVMALNILISRLLPSGMVPRVQDPITFPTIASEPEPDLVIASGTLKTYRTRHPRPKDIFLLVEVADSSLSVDQGLKLQAYASEKISPYWIVNLVAGQIEAHTHPRTLGELSYYQKRQYFQPGELIPVCLRSKEIGQLAVSDILP